MRINANVCFFLSFLSEFVTFLICTIQELHWRDIVDSLDRTYRLQWMFVAKIIFATFALFRHVALLVENREWRCDAMWSGDAMLGSAEQREYSRSQHTARRLGDSLQRNVASLLTRNAALQ